MKHILTTATLVIVTGFAMAQTKPPTFKIPLSQQDIQQQYGTLQAIGQKLHTVHVDGLLRDSLDNLIGGSVQMLSVRYREAFIADSLANFKHKP